jgi:hypothetical protein
MPQSSSNMILKTYFEGLFFGTPLKMLYNAKHQLRPDLLQNIELALAMLVFKHEINKSQKLLLEIGKTELSGLANRMVWFCRFRQQSVAPPTLDKGASPPAK